MLGHYLIVALRSFRRRGFLCAIKVLALSMGLVCFVGAYVLIHYLDSTDRQFAKSDRIAVMRENFTWKTTGAKIGFVASVAAPTAKALKAEFPELPALARSDDGTSAVKAGDNKSFRRVRYADPDFLKIFDFDFVSGGGPDALTQPKSAVVSVEAAQALFGTTDVLGKTMRLGNAVNVTVTGVVRDAPPPSHLGRTLISDPFEILVSMDVNDAFSKAQSGEATSEVDDWMSNQFTLYVLLPADGSLTLDQFNRRLQGFGERHVPPAQGVANFDAIPLPDLTKSYISSRYTTGTDGPPIETVLYLLGGLILFVACLDFANVATAEAAGRSKEVGLRRVLGASSRQVATQSLMEAALLVGLSALIALAVIALCVHLMNRPADIGMRLPGIGDIGFWLFLSAVLGVVTLGAGGYPAAILARVRPITALRAGTVRGGSRSVRAVLVTVQFAAASFLLVAVIVMHGNMKAIEASALARTPDPYVLIGTRLDTAGIDPQVFRNALLADRRIKAVTASEMPFLMGGYGSILELSRGPGATDRIVAVQRRSVGESYFQTLEIPFVAGRAPSLDRAGDVGPATMSGLITATNGPGLVIDRSTAQGLGWKDAAAAVGQTVYLHIPPIPGLNPALRLLPAEVIGVIENTPFQVTAPISTSYIYYLQPAMAPLPIIRIDKGDIQGALAHIDAVWNRLAPDSPMRRSFMDEQLARALSLYETIGDAFMALALFAVFIAAMGLIGMASYVVGRRVKEIGIRKTLGATTSQVLARLLWEFSHPVLVANLLAWPLAYIAMQSYLSLFSMRQPLTVLPFLAALLATLALTWAAVLAQAWRAARVKPARVLRYE